MADLGVASSITQTPSVFDYQSIGTAAGTTIVSAYPAYIHSITVTQRVASGSLVLFDSSGTSSSVIATIALGTQTYGDAPTTYTFDVRTKTAITVVNSANVGAVVSFGK